MPEFESQVFVCNGKTDDGNHCGDKGSAAIRARFNELLKEHDLLGKVMISNTGCTSQHRFCETEQGSITVYGPGADKGGTWYIVTPDNVEEVITQHLKGGQKVDSLVNDRVSVKLD